MLSFLPLLFQPKIILVYLFGLPPLWPVIFRFSVVIGVHCPMMLFSTISFIPNIYFLPSPRAHLNNCLSAMLIRIYVFSCQLMWECLQHLIASIMQKKLAALKRHVTTPWPTGRLKTHKKPVLF